MPLSYIRLRNGIAVTRQSDETAIVTLSRPFVTQWYDREVNVPCSALDSAAAGNDVPLRNVLSSWLDSMAYRVVDPSADFVVERFDVAVGEPRWAAIDWESFLGPTANGAAIVRVSEVVPRVLQNPFTFPARILEIDTPSGVESLIRGTFGSYDPTLAFVVGQTSLSGARTFLESSGWPTAEVLHFGSLGMLPREVLLRTATPDVPGTLGWTLRAADLWQTRLILIESVVNLPALREYAQRIVARGGPAVWLVPPGDPIRLAYEYLVHDRPLDWIQRSLGTCIHPPDAALFAGTNGEEALRFSHIGMALATADPEHIERPVDVAPRSPISDTIAIPEAAEPAILLLGMPDDEFISLWDDSKPFLRHLEDDKSFGHGDVSTDVAFDPFLPPGLRSNQRGKFPELPIDRSVRALRGGSRKPARRKRATLPARTKDAIRDVGMIMPTVRFEQHESEGVIPLANAVQRVRNELRKGRPRRRAAKAKPRNVNGGFFSIGDGRPQRIPESGALLTPGALVHLGVQIGAEKLFTTVGPTALIEEYFRWKGPDDVRYLEIGVTPLDFDLLGEPVQEFRLPAVGETDLITFPVRPKATTAIPGVARIRFSLYCNNNIVQSFRIAALIGAPTAPSASPRRRLAAALGVDEAGLGDIGDAGYVTRLEYSALASIDAALSVPQRALSIVANDSAGQKVVTFKGADLFTYNTDQNMVGKVSALRESLSRAARNKANEYRYGEDNTGDVTALQPLLYDVAEKGWSLFRFLIPDGDERRRVTDALQSGGTIHAAHIDLGDVIPWSLIYDREIDSGHVADLDEKGVNVTVPQLLCAAAMPQPDGTLPPGECEADATCVLHPDRVAERKAKGQLVCADAVVCPRRFWGYRHPIEVPVQKVGTNVPPDPVTTIACPSVPEVFAGFNPLLSRAQSGAHEKTLRAALTTARRPAALPSPVQVLRNRIKQLLEKGETEPDIIYFYCHANATSTLADGTTIGPNLDFGAARTRSEVFEPSQLDGRKWPHRPLVFLNGCGTVGFSPCAPSEFITLFVQGRKASAVIGSEVTIWEVLADEMARLFFTRFLDFDKDGKAITAGESLLYARRMLLAKRNPLGLVYTLYGSADLRLA